MNETIKTQLNHRSIRQFKPLALTQEEVDLLVDVARHTATSNLGNPIRLSVLLIKIEGRNC